MPNNATLAIETSCDETALSLLKARGNLDSLEIEIINELVATQIKVHRKYGGVVPGLARREHEKNLPVLFDKLLTAHYLPQTDVIAVTVGPGLDPCLWSGINFAKKIHKEHFFSAKLLGVNHLEGHLYSFLLDEKFRISKKEFQANGLKSIFPAVALIVSGGHTMLILMESMIKWKKLGETRDDAVGEAFDKVARLLGFSYPGGPEIEKAASLANPTEKSSRSTSRQSRTLPSFPEPMVNSKNYDFSYSGLKTAVLYYLKENPGMSREKVAYSFQEAAFAPLVKKTERAVKEYSAKSIFLSGGVAANKALRKKLKAVARVSSAGFYVAPSKYNTDNAVIIALASYINTLSGKEYKLESQPGLSLS